MKRITTIFALLIMMCMSSWAQVAWPTLTTDPSNPVLYSIQSYRSYRFLQYAGDDAKPTQTYDFSEASTKFYFVPVNGTDFTDGVKIVSNVNGKQINEMSGFATEGTTWYLGESTYASGFFNISKTSSFDNNTCWDCNSSGNMTANYWHANTEGSTWQIAEAPQYETSTLANPKWYYLKTGRGRYVYANGTAAGTNMTNPKTDDYKFAFVSVGGTGVNIVSKTGLANNSNMYLTTTPGLSSDASTWYYFGAAQYAGYFILSDDASGYGYPHLLNDNGNGGLAKWYVDGTGSYFQVEEVLPVCDVTYTYTYGGKQYTATETQNIGAPVSLPASIAFPYTNYTFSTDVVPDAATATINVTVDGFNMPFTASTDYDNARWYYLRGHASYNKYYISTNGTDVGCAEGTPNSNAYKWAFIGNPYDGIKVINKASGEGYFLNGTDPITMGTTEKTWTLKKQENTSWNSGDKGFGLYDNTLTYANCRPGTPGSIKYWSSFDQGSTFWVNDVTVNVTFNLVVDGTPINTVVAENATGYSNVSVPASLGLSNYSSLAYDFTNADGAVVLDEDVTVDVTATLKAGVVTDLVNLSNAKAYTLTTDRGSLYIKSDHLASNSNANTGATAGKFALLKFAGEYFLYSVDASKFVLGDGTLSETVTSDVVALNMTAQTIKPLYFMVLGSKGLNVTNTNDDYELAINTWVTADPGNRYCITEVDNFDATTALAALDANGATFFANAIAQLKAINWGSGPNQYRLTGGAYVGYAGNEATLIQLLEDAGYSSDALEAANDMLANYALNLPSAGFYRIKGNTSGTYLAAGNASNSNFNMSDAIDATTIFYFDGYQLINFGSGLSNGMSSSRWAWVLGSGASTVTFQDGLTNGGYAIKSYDRYFYDNGDDNIPCADRGNVTIGSQANARYTNWYLETVNELPVALNEISGKYYATLYLPVAATITGATAYSISVDNTDPADLKANPVEITTAIPASTAILLVGASNTATATVSTETPAAIQTALEGTLAAIDVSSTSTNVKGDTDYFFGKINDVPGFYHWAGETLKAFRAYLPASAVGGTTSKGLTLVDGEATGINGINAEQADGQAIYNLQGQRVNKAQRGIYIVGGKKVVIK